MDGRRLEGQIAVVTGSDSGIGQATAIAFAREGADVTVTYFHDKPGAEKTKKAIEAQGRRAAVIHLDQRDPVSVENLFTQTRAQLGAPTLLVNNAALGDSGVAVKDTTLEQWDNEIKTNLYGPFYCCREFLRHFDGSKQHGIIINITSVHEEIPAAGAAAYDAAKGGLRNLTRTLALELADKNINVNNIAPGMVLTPMNQEALDNPEVRRQQEKPIPMKRAAKPEEIAKVAVFLASEDARYVHGESVFVDGGLMQNVGQGA
jgi:glucose 1-dehydrogenase